MHAHMAQYFRQQMGLGPRPATADAIAPAVVQYYVMGAVYEPGAPGMSTAATTKDP